MVKVGSNERLYSAAKIAASVEALAAEGVSAAAALKGVGILHDTLNSPPTRVALDQIIECYHNTARLTRDPSATRSCWALLEARRKVEKAPAANPSAVAAN